MSGNDVTVAEALHAWIARRLDPSAHAWLADQLERVRGAATDRALYTAFGRAPEKLGKADLALDATDLARAQVCRAGWDPSGWSVDQAARILLVLQTHDGEGAPFAERLERLFVTADVGEAVALYRGLPLYPEQERYVARASEGARSNMRALFEAVAHDNPFPAERFSESAWNHMVVKALFIGSQLAPIRDLERRQNAELATMLRGYAHERWAAGRTVSPEVWRCVGRYGDQGVVDDLARVLASDSAADRRAAALALHANGSAAARAVLKSTPDLERAIVRGTLTWATVNEPAATLTETAS